MLTTWAIVRDRALQAQMDVKLELAKARKRGLRWATVFGAGTTWCWSMTATVAARGLASARGPPGAARASSWAAWGAGATHWRNPAPPVLKAVQRIRCTARAPSPTKWTVSKAFKAGAGAAGYSPCPAACLRHSTASEMINAGVDLYTTGGVLGHNSAVSTKRYSHLATKTLKSAVALVGKKARTTAKKKAA